MNIEQLESEYRQNKAEVIEMLVNNCMKVDREIPRVVCGNFEQDLA